MKTLCFALILSQNAKEESSPPVHVQDLLKKRILYQIKQQSPDKQFFFDEPTCEVLGSYNYVDEAVQIQSTDKEVDIQLPYTDILNGKKLEISALSSKIESKENIIASAMNQNAFESSNLNSNTQSGTRKWLPWIIVGAVGLSLGAYGIYNSMERKGGESENSGRSKRSR